MLLLPSLQPLLEREMRLLEVGVASLNKDVSEKPDHLLYSVITISYTPLFLLDDRML